MVKWGDSRFPVALQDFALVAAGDDLVEARPVVALIVQANVVLRDLDHASPRIQLRLLEHVFLDRVALHRFDRGRRGVRRQALDLLGVVSFGDQLRLGLGHDIMEATVAGLDITRGALDAEFFRRDAHDADLRTLALLRIVTSWKTGAGIGGGKSAPGLAAGADAFGGAAGACGAVPCAISSWPPSSAARHRQHGPCVR
jgi:hypothetical protein